MLFHAILFLAAYLPFQVALNPASGIDAASVRVIVLGIFGVWLVKSLKERKLDVPANFQTACLATFLFLNAFSLFFARNIDWSLRKLAFLFSLFPLYFVVAASIKEKKETERVVAAMVFSATAAAMLGIGQFAVQFFIGTKTLVVFWMKYVAIIFLGKTVSQSVFNHPSWLVDISGRTYFRAISVFPDPHMLALFLGLVLPLALALFFEHKKKRWLFCAAIIFLADILTFSRGGYVGLLGGLMFLLFVFRRKLFMRYKIWSFLGLAFLIIVLIAPGPISRRFFSSFNLEEGSNSGRLAMWREAEKNIAEHPLFGVGIGNFPLAVDPLVTYREPIYAHNTYLDVGVEAGILAAVAWLGALGFSIMALLNKAKKDGLYLGMAVGLVIFAGHSLFETGLYSPVVLTLALFIMAFSNSQEKNAQMD